METKLNFKQIMLAGLTAAGVSAVVNAILFFIFHAIGIITDDIFVQPEQPLTVVPVIISSILPTIVASLGFFMFEKFLTNGFKIYRIVALILLVLSLAGPFTGIPGITTVYGIALCTMHVVVVFSFLYFFAKSSKANS